ncbi:hypothetical protein B4U80_09102 [Leptotrombidium deliense]|uniref:NADH dehydrogenase [ubiquinone] 1 alpha subcomplex subunit 9, mitochondrial n=1 Tax=Leptotrombidium deliense TaxID=299467 RepID=A0A443SUC9_9ACAR|nr:hypothetical protein B4U80_09102 [Leptotrombidium deliense]
MLTRSCIGNATFDVCVKVNAVSVRSINTNSSDVEKSERSLQPEVSKFPSPGAAALRKGTGGRSSFNGTVCTVFGATGFLGRILCNKLGKIGTQLIIPFRKDPYDVRALKVMGDLGQVLFFPFYLRNEESIYKTMKYSNVVINLIGKDIETPSFTYDEVHVEGARMLARVARQAGVQRFIHVSALNSSPNPKQHTWFAKGGSQFLKTKYYGEVAVREEFPEATILRPADMFGLEDRFLNYYHRFSRNKIPNNAIWLWNRGLGTYKQPVYVGDVAQGIVNAIYDPEAPGKTYDCVGPKRYELLEIVRYIKNITQREEEFGFTIGDLRHHPLFYLRVKFFSYIWHHNMSQLCTDKVERESVSDELIPGNLTLEDLGVNLSPMENYAMLELRPKRRHAFYCETIDELPIPAHPRTVEPLIAAKYASREFKQATV